MTIESLRAYSARVSIGEAMAFRVRMRQLCARLRPYTKISDGKLVAGLLGVCPDTVRAWRAAKWGIGKKSWLIFGLAEIAARSDPQAVAEYVEFRLEDHDEAYESRTSLTPAFSALEVTADLESVK